MREPKWLSVDAATAMHAEQVALFGGPVGIRDITLLESALARPVNKFAYGEFDLAALAAAYAFGIARNHPFIDGNKRAAFQAMIVFLGMNGVVLEFKIAEAITIILDLAAGLVSEDSLARWIRDNWPKA